MKSVCVWHEYVSQFMWVSNLGGCNVWVISWICIPVSRLQINAILVYKSFKHKHANDIEMNFKSQYLVFVLQRPILVSFFGALSIVFVLNAECNHMCFLPGNKLFHFLP